MDALFVRLNLGRGLAVPLGHVELFEANIGAIVDEADTTRRRRFFPRQLDAAELLPIEGE